MTVGSNKGSSHRFLSPVTGYGQEEDRRRALETGFDDHLVKSVTLEHLRRLVDNAPATSSDDLAADLTG